MPILSCFTVVDRSTDLFALMWYHFPPKIWAPVSLVSVENDEIAKTALSQAQTQSFAVPAAPLILSGCLMSDNYTYIDLYL